MRLGVVLDRPAVGDAAAVEAAGLDLVWIDEAIGVPLVLAAAVGAATSAVRIVAAVRAGMHPVELAEEAAVADLSSGGRLILAVGSDDEAELAETVDVLFRSFAARPFRHEGSRWTIPANLPEHEAHELQLRVTPPPAQLELPIWLWGSAAPAVARSHGLTFVPASDARAEWEALDGVLGAATARLRRVARVPIALPMVSTEVAAALLAGREAWGLDVAVLALAGGDRRQAFETLARWVRPRVQLDRVLPALEQHWVDEEEKS
jgi:alkanesulfonate monooxygenase SsuD/methylene tetrahydromethanopterin reductase-like flavin-dependent oxidoreductase (luciferase family)